MPTIKKSPNSSSSYKTARGASSSKSPNSSSSYKTATAASSSNSAKSSSSSKSPRTAKGPSSRKYAKSASSRISPRTAKQRCDKDQRCKQGTRCNKKKPEYCEKTQASVNNTRKLSPSSQKKSKREKDSKLDIMRADKSYNELGIRQTDFFEDVCLVLKNIRNKLHISSDPSDRTMEWSNEKIVELHNFSPFITNIQGEPFKSKMVLSKRVLTRDLYLGPHLIHATNIIGEGAFGKIYKGTFDDKECAIKQSLQSITTESDIIKYYTEIIIHNELFCQAHRQALSHPKYAKIPKPFFMARLHNTPLLGMEPIDDSLFNFIRESEALNLDDELVKIQYQVKMTNIIIDMFECISNTLIYLQDNYDFYHRDMHAGNIMYRKQGESYQWYLIDFGKSIFKLNNYHFNSQGTDMYGIYDTTLYNNGKGKVGHDLRLILVYIFTVLNRGFYNMMLIDAYKILNFIYADINTKIRNKRIGIGKDIFWHRCYDTFDSPTFDILVTDETDSSDETEPSDETDPRLFLAKTIPKLRQVVAKKKGHPL